MEKERKEHKAENLRERMGLKRKLKGDLLVKKEHAAKKMMSMEQAQKREYEDNHLTTKERIAFMKHHKLPFKKKSLNEDFSNHIWK
jgi:hypothetical protein